MNNTRKLTLFACLLAVALILGYIESLIPIPIGIPGIKIGLPNIVSLIVLTTFGFLPAILIVISRVLIAGFLFGTMSSIIYALSGGLLAVIVMFTLLSIQKPIKHSLMFVSVIGAISHNIGQLIIAVFVIQNASLFFFYLPFLILAAIPAGVVTGAAAQIMLNRFNRH